MTALLEQRDCQKVSVQVLEPSPAFPRIDWAPQWNALIPDLDAHQVSLTSAEFTEAGLLRADLEDWSLFCAADIMLVADSVDAIGRGQFTLLLAEVHHIMPPASLPFITFHPQADEMARELLYEQRKLVAPARPALQAVQRSNKSRDHVPLDHALICHDWLRHEPHSEAVPISALRVVLDARNDPQLVTDDSPVPLALFPEYPEVEPGMGWLEALALPAMDKEPILLAQHTPRITVDGIIYQRESWVFQAEALTLPQVAYDSFDEYLALWQWKADHRLPDQVFVRLSGEEKPFILDFLSIVSCEAYLHARRRSTGAMITEMLPDPEQLWLKSKEGAHCCELRLTLFRARAGDR